MYLPTALVLLLGAAGLVTAAPVAVPASNDVAFPQVYGAHQLKTKEDDFKKREESFPQVYGAHQLKMDEDDV